MSDTPQRQAERPSDDQWLDRVVGNLLRAGVVTAAAVVLFGGVIYLARHGFDRPHYNTFRGEPANLRSISGIVGDVFSASGRGIIEFGLLLLIATPVMRVVMLLVGFARQRDRLYMLVSFVVLACLLFSLFGGRF